jgi:hypothetical protein
MKKFLSAFLIYATICGQVIGAERPTVNVPMARRHRNWLGPQGEGSCVHASMVYLLHWMGRHKEADWWLTHNGDGEWDTDLAEKFDRAHIRYAYTSEKGNVKFLEWALKTHRGCGVTVMGGKHMIVLVHLDEKWAGLWDNNYPTKFRWVPRKTFIAEWLNSHSWAVTPVYTPSAPLPTK